MKGQKQLDLGWIPEEGPVGLPEETREELVRLMAAALVAVCTPPKEGADDERCAREDRN